MKYSSNVRLCVLLYLCSPYSALHLMLSELSFNVIQIKDVKRIEISKNQQQKSGSNNNYFRCAPQNCTFKFIIIIVIRNLVSQYFCSTYNTFSLLGIFFFFFFFFFTSVSQHHHFLQTQLRLQYTIIYDQLVYIIKHEMVI